MSAPKLLLYKITVVFLIWDMTTDGKELLYLMSVTFVTEWPISSTNTVTSNHTIVAFGGEVFCCDMNSILGSNILCVCIYI